MKMIDYYRCASCGHSKGEHWGPWLQKGPCKNEFCYCKKYAKENEDNDAMQ